MSLFLSIYLLLLTPTTSLAQTQSVTRDATCGGSKGLTCLGSKWGNCCSNNGWCGSTEAYCGTGCQSKFGACRVNPASSRIVAPSPSAIVVSSSRAAPISSTPSQLVSTNARCGSKFGGQTCQGSKWGNCCSQYSYCGSTIGYCDAATCQKGFGQCNGEASSAQMLSTFTTYTSRSASSLSEVPSVSSSSLVNTPSQSSVSSIVSSSSIPSSLSLSSIDTASSMSSSAVVSSSLAVSSSPPVVSSSPPVVSSSPPVVSSSSIEVSPSATPTPTPPTCVDPSPSVCTGTFTGSFAGTACPQYDGFCNSGYQLKCYVNASPATFIDNARKSIPGGNLDVCIEHCKTVPGCVYATWNGNSNTCYVYSELRGFASTTFRTITGAWKLCE
ncbi:hypothetical protein BDU57DRAFT_469463 [Ampelomyces quisqualis]|uniref:Chitin-binding type-1 domain-containing protein n=1 Tax=Ampelomyces quisqualis TaxID=50730 RepID=A0A6A5QWW1_AMPQU|nr:hypothetical protein BDU57DRAFT_469463 [Ampelomyces quisqualis]